MLNTVTAAHGIDRGEELLADVLSCVNSEAKNIAIALCLNGTPKTVYSIHNAFEQAVGRGWIPGHLAIHEYFTKTFIPAGAAEQSVTFSKRRKTDGANTFKVTQKGRDVIQPLAAFTLKYAVDNKISISGILGSNKSTGEYKSPYRRARILETLAETELSHEELIYALGIGRESTRRHLKALEGMKFVDCRIKDPTKKRIPPASAVEYILEPGKRFSKEYLGKVRGFLDGGHEQKEIDDIYRAFLGNYVKRLEYASKGVKLLNEYRGERLFQPSDF